MSYRLDEGKGRCTYHIGVEDDGCHSLLDYSAVSESAWVLESIARSLNAVILERKMIQKEINNDEDGNLKLVDNVNEVIVVNEPPVLGRLDNGFHHEDEKEEKSCGNEVDDVSESNTMAKLSAADGVYTRCELTIQRIETHLLDPSPLSLSSLSRGSSFGEGVEGAVDATTMKKENVCPKKETTTSNNDTDTEPKATSVEETLSSRNIRVAVVGNVGKSFNLNMLAIISLSTKLKKLYCALQMPESRHLSEH